MGTVRDFRRQRLIDMIRATPGKDTGKQKRFAEAHGLDPAHVSQMVNGTREMGDDVARRIESAADFPHGTMDMPPPIATAEPRPVYTADTFSIPRLDFAGSMGPGISSPEHVEVVESIRVHLPQLRREVTFTAPQNLRIGTGYGDSMQPTFSDGDPLLVDTGITQIKIDAVYVMKRGDDVYIKRIQRRPDGAFLMISDNKSYEVYIIADAERAQFKICGRVLLAWNARRL